MVYSCLIVLNIFSCRKTKTKEPVLSLQGSGRSNEPFVPEARDVQQAESTDWTAIVGGTAVALVGLFLAGRAAWQNRENQ